MVAGARKWIVLIPCALAACGGPRLATQTTYPHYAAPGPANDPWRPYIQEASSHYGVPERWIRQVMRQESGGHETLNGQPITSDAGAMGLMQIMPATYSELAGRYGLGADPYDPHDNIMAGAAYIRELYDKYGSPAFLAAYNAGPQRLEEYMAGRSSLPNETVNYLASIAPTLGDEKPVSGPLAVYAARDDIAGPAPVMHAYVPPARPGCWQDPDKAYDPDAPCRLPPAAPVVVASAPPPVSAGPTRIGSTLWASAAPAVSVPPPSAHAPVLLASAAPARHVTRGRCWHDPNRAYDPDAPCETPPPPTPVAAPILQASARLPTAPSNPATTRPVRVAASRGPERCYHDPDKAFDPFARCDLRPTVQVALAAAPAAPPSMRHSRFALIPTAAAAEAPRPIAAPGRWTVQLGTYASRAEAEDAASAARRRAAQDLGGSRTVLAATAPFGGHVLYRARLAGLDYASAAAGCARLAAQSVSCTAVPPGN